MLGPGLMQRPAIWVTGLHRQRHQNICPTGPGWTETDESFFHQLADNLFNFNIKEIAPPNAPCGGGPKPRHPLFLFTEQITDLETQTC